MSTQRDAQSCDLFVYAAVQLALEELKKETRLALDSVVTKDFNGTEFSNVSGF